MGEIAYGAATIQMEVVMFVEQMNDPRLVELAAWLASKPEANVIDQDCPLITDNDLRSYVNSGRLYRVGSRYIFFVAGHWLDTAPRCVLFTKDELNLQRTVEVVDDSRRFVDAKNVEVIDLAALIEELSDAIMDHPGVETTEAVATELARYAARLFIGRFVPDLLTTMEAEEDGDGT